MKKPPNFDRNAHSMIETPRLLIKSLSTDDASLVATFHTTNREFMTNFAPTRLDEFYTSEFWQKRLAEFETMMLEDKHYSFFIFERYTSNVIGWVNFSNVVRGPFQGCHLGYELSPAAEGKGFMSEALKALIDYMFVEKNLHRIMANYVPDNHKSERVLQKLGFQRDGLAKDYLFLGGSWKDHVLTSLTDPAWKPQ